MLWPLSLPKHSNIYLPLSLYTELPEARAILLGRLGSYEQALGLYAHVLKDPAKAEKFCIKIYDQDGNANSEVRLVHACILCHLHFCLEDVTSSSWALFRRRHGEINVFR